MNLNENLNNSIDKLNTFTLKENETERNELVELYYANGGMTDSTIANEIWKYQDKDYWIDQYEECWGTYKSTEETRDEWINKIKDGTYSDDFLSEFFRQEFDDEPEKYINSLTDEQVNEILNKVK